MHDASDDALLAGMAAGDADATAAFVRRFQQRVYGLARTMLPDPSAAEEVAQEAFVRAWRHAASFDGRRGSVPTWLLAITRNVAIDALRAQRARPVDPVADFEAMLVSSRPGPAALAETSDEADRVRRALALLPEPQRRAVLLASFGGRTAKEIGELDGIPLGTAKTRIRSGLSRLRLALEVEERTS